MLKITKGEVTFDTGANSHFFDYRVIDDENCIAFTDEEFAPIICEAFNVANETGLTPRQLLEQRDELLESLKKYKFAVDQMNEAMKDGGNVQGEIGMLIAAEEDVEMAIAKAEASK